MNPDLSMGLWCQPACDQQVEPSTHFTSTMCTASLTLEGRHSLHWPAFTEVRAGAASAVQWCPQVQRESKSSQLLHPALPKSSDVWIHRTHRGVAAMCAVGYTSLCMPPVLVHGTALEQLRSQRFTDSPRFPQQGMEPGLKHKSYKLSPTSFPRC